MIEYKMKFLVIYLDYFNFLAIWIMFGYLGYFYTLFLSISLRVKNIENKNIKNVSNFRSGSLSLKDHEK